MWRVVQNKQPNKSYCGEGAFTSLFLSYCATTWMYLEQKRSLLFLEETASSLIGPYSMSSKEPQWVNEHERIHAHTVTRRQLHILCCVTFDVYLEGERDM